MEEKKKGNGGLIVLVVISLLLCIGMGCFIFINKEKLTAKENTEVSEEKDNKSKNNNIKDSKEENIVQEDTTVNNVTENDNNYTEKVYSWNGSTIVLFKSGKCVVTSGQEYTAHCNYNLDNNSINITRYKTGPSAGIETTYTYNITLENGEEYIVSSTNNDDRYKLLK